MKGIMLMGEPMGLFIAQSPGPLDKVTGYSLAVAGAEFNVAVGLARLQHSVTYVTKLGNDPFGKLIVNVLSQNNIGCEFITFSSERNTGFMLKSMVSQGDPEIFYFRKGSAASTLSKEDVESIDFSKYSLIHLTGILPALTSSTREAVYYLIEKAHENNLIVSFDPNLRPQLWESKSLMIDVINDMASKADIFLPGQNEGQILMGSSDPEDISCFYIKSGTKTVITKLGSKGCYVAKKEEGLFVPGFKVEKIVDTVGAGDGFAAGVISGLIEGIPLKDAALRGNAIGAIQVMSRGDNDGLPNRKQLSDFMGSSSI